MTEVVTTSPPLGCAAVMMGLFRAALQEQRLPVTHQREAIARVLFESGRHLSADDVAERLRDRGEQLGKATIYRTLNLLVEVGLATEHDFDEGFKRYETRAGPSHHDHLICTSCGSVTEFDRPELEALQQDVARARGFQVLTRQLKLYGLCAECGAESEDGLLRAG
ncbi:MAG: transcriptional repressor [Gemmatimonadota bacterium]|nr:transcriptional repressor [Gemmatimonadota bacterium]